MQKHITSKNTRLHKIGGIKFAIDNGKLLIHAPREQYPFPLSGCDTLALFNLLADYRTDIVTLAVVEQRAREKANKERQGHKKPQMMQVDGRWVEGVELSELEEELND